MKILALEPYYGGSHRAFLDGWSARSRHSWTVLHLPAYKWKWRMRHAAVTMADAVAQRTADGQRWDLLFASDMLNLAEFVGLAPPAVQRLPSVAYFHENQLTYPVSHESERDYHFALTNMTTALAADGVWFNSAFHRDSFLQALPVLLRKMPDHQPFDAVQRIAAKSCVRPPGIEDFPPRGQRNPGPIRILWAARWEHDKNPETFFEALKIIQAQGIDFRVSAIGQRFRQVPPIFARAQDHFAAHIDRWGYQDTRAEYRAALCEADVMVSTAQHEFFGISVVEAVAAGAYPLLPTRLAYPEILGLEQTPSADSFFFDGTAGQLADRLAALARRLRDGDLWQGDPDRGVRSVARFAWSDLCPLFDDALEQMVQQP